MTRNKIHITLALFFLSLLLIQPVFSQERQDSLPDSSQATNAIIDFGLILDRLINGSETVVRFRNQSIDLGNYSLRKIDRLFANAKIDSGSLIINKRLEFHNCTITGKGLYNLKIEQILFNNCKIASLSMTNLNVSRLEVSGGSLYGIRILNSTFNKLYLLNLSNFVKDVGYISLFKIKVLDELQISNNNYYQNIGLFASHLDKVKFAGNKSRLIGMANNQVHNEVLFQEESAQEFRIRKNIFLSRDTLRYTFDIDCDKFVFIENELEVPVLFADTKVSTRIDMSDNTFAKAVDFHDVSFPEFGRYIPFSQFKEGFVVYKNLYGEESPDGANCYYCELYTGNTDEEIADKTNFDKLVQSYEILFLGYKSTGDIESANLSYIQIKNLYLNRLGYLYRTHGGFKHYFRWKLAQLLKFYTNHGTDPALSIVISIYVILIFAVFYIFFPSEWDVTSKARLIADFREFMDKNDKGYFKPFLALVVGFSISIINAITLSLNSFVTLGFGTIPTTGAARYVCILQGFIGWFLLSIFTVSLINQILF
jgi:hypothetical protein